MFLFATTRRRQEMKETYKKTSAEQEVEEEKKGGAPMRGTFSFAHAKRERGGTTRGEGEKYEERGRE